MKRLEEAKSDFKMTANLFPDLAACLPPDLQSDFALQADYFPTTVSDQPPSTDKSKRKSVSKKRGTAEIRVENAETVPNRAECSLVSAESSNGIASIIK